jgi:hypothetical protein
MAIKVSKEIRLTIDDLLQSVAIECPNCNAAVVVGSKVIGIGEWLTCPRCRDGEEARKIKGSEGILESLAALRSQVGKGKPVVTFRIQIED